MFLALLQSSSILVIPSQLADLLLYGFLFVTITLFPRGISASVAADGRSLAPCPSGSRRVTQATLSAARMEYIYTILVLIAIFVILSSSYNLVIGYGGLTSVAHPIFFALGAYASALLAIHFGAAAPLVCVAGGRVRRRDASVLLALSALRVSGDYLLIASIGFQLGLLQVIKNFEFTGGAGGLSAIPEHHHGPVAQPAFLMICGGRRRRSTVWLIARIMHGPYGRAITAMRDDELAFSALGRNAMTMKVIIFAIGCGIAGLAGGLYALYFQFVSPEQFEILHSAAILTMVVLGGMGTTSGPVVGAVAAHRAPAGDHLPEPAARGHGADAGHASSRPWCCCSCSCGRRAWSAPEQGPLAGRTALETPGGPAE